MSPVFMYDQFNIQQFCVLPTQCIYVFCGSEDKQRLFPYTASTDWFFWFLPYRCVAITNIYYDRQTQQCFIY